MELKNYQLLLDNGFTDDQIITVMQAEMLINDHPGDAQPDAAPENDASPASETSDNSAADVAKPENATSPAQFDVKGFNDALNNTLNSFLANMQKTIQTANISNSQMAGKQESAEDILTKVVLGKLIPPPGK